MPRAVCPIVKMWATLLYVLQAPLLRVIGVPLPYLKPEGMHPPPCGMSNRDAIILPKQRARGSKVLYSARVQRAAVEDLRRRGSPLSIALIASVSIRRSYQPFEAKIVDDSTISIRSHQPTPPPGPRALSHQAVMQHDLAISSSQLRPGSAHPSPSQGLTPNQRASSHASDA